MLEAGLRLQKAGCRGVGVASGELEARWRALHRRVKQESVNTERNRKLKNKFVCGSAVLTDWMGGARVLIDKWSQITSAYEDTDLEQRREHYHQFMRWMETLTQQEVLLELQGCQVEMSSHQATLDYVNQPLQTCGTDDDQRGRYEHNQFAEEQRRLNHQWLSLQETLNSEIQEAEQELRSRAEREARLQRINSWMTDQNLWMESAQTPSSLTELQRSISTCQDLQEKIKLKSAALQELRDKHGGGGNSSQDFICQTDNSTQTCAALMQQNESVNRRLIEVQQLWDCAENRLNEMMLKTVRTSQTLDYHSGPPFSLQAHRHLHERLQ
eukprot:superscaffoldBa00005630_g20585